MNGAAVSQNVFVYSRSVRSALLVCVFVWLAAVAVTHYTSIPKRDAPWLVNALDIVLLACSFATGVVYVMSKRFYVAIEDGTVRWRYFVATHEYKFVSLHKIEFRLLNRGLEEIG